MTNIPVLTWIPGTRVRPHDLGCAAARFRAALRDHRSQFAPRAHGPGADAVQPVPAGRASCRSRAEYHVPVELVNNPTAYTACLTTDLVSRLIRKLLLAFREGTDLGCGDFGLGFGIHT